MIDFTSLISRRSALAVGASGLSIGLIGLVVFTVGSEQPELPVQPCRAAARVLRRARLSMVARSWRQRAAG
jgi:hypothetical protein